MCVGCGLAIFQFSMYTLYVLYDGWRWVTVIISVVWSPIINSSYRIPVELSSSHIDLWIWLGWVHIGWSTIGMDPTTYNKLFGESMWVEPTCISFPSILHVLGSLLAMWVRCRVGRLPTHTWVWSRGSGTEPMWVYHLLVHIPKGNVHKFHVRKSSRSCVKSK